MEDFYSNDSQSNGVVQRHTVHGKRSRNKVYEFSNIYDSANEAEKKLEAEMIWTKTKYIECKYGGNKQFYRCNLARFRDKQCEASVYVLYHNDSEKASIFRTTCAHTHMERIKKIKTTDDTKIRPTQMTTEMAMKLSEMRKSVQPVSESATNETPAMDKNPAPSTCVLDQSNHTSLTENHRDDENKNLNSNSANMDINFGEQTYQTYENEYEISSNDQSSQNGMDSSLIPLNKDNMPIYNEKEEITRKDFELSFIMLCDKLNVDDKSNRSILFDYIKNLLPNENNLDEDTYAQVESRRSCKYCAELIVASACTNPKCRPGNQLCNFVQRATQKSVPRTNNVENHSDGSKMDQIMSILGKLQHELKCIKASKGLSTEPDPFA